MQVILLQDVARIGRRHTVVEVPDGFAINKLIPMKAAVAATKVNLARYAEQRAHSEQTKKQEAASLAESLKALADIKVVVEAQANEKGHLFKAVTKEMIADATTALGASLPVDSIMPTAPIKDVGDHQVKVSGGGHEGTITVSIIAKK